MSLETLAEIGFRNFDISPFQGHRSSRSVFGSLFPDIMQIFPKGTDFPLLEEDGILITSSTFYPSDDLFQRVAENFVGYLNKKSGQRFHLHKETDETKPAGTDDVFSVRTAEHLPAYWIEKANLDNMIQGTLVLYILQDPRFPSTIDLNPYIEMNKPKHS